MAKSYPVSKEGFEKLEKELAELKIKRKDVIARLKAAKEFGDLSENSEYEDAKNEQTFVETKMAELIERVKHATIVSKLVSNGKVGLGSQIVVKSNIGEEAYELVGATESNPLKGKVSLESPFGKAFVGAKVGDVIKVNAPDGQIDYKIVKIS